MYSPQDILADIAEEIRIVKHLVTTIPHDKHEHRFSNEQRTIKELLIYIASQWAGFTKYMESGNMKDMWDYKDSLGDVTATNFNEKIEESFSVIKEYVENTTNRKAEFDLFGMTKKEKIWGLVFILKNIVAYRMQLFLQIKHAGNTTIWTSDNRMGVSKKA